MEARERLARVVALSYCRNDIEPDSEATWALYMDDGRHCADAILKALHLTDAAALALMDGGGRVVPIYPTDEMCDAAWESEGTDYVGEHHRIHCFGDAYTAALSASPYKETTNDR